MPQHWMLPTVVQQGARRLCAQRTCSWRTTILQSLDAKLVSSLYKAGLDPGQTRQETAQARTQRLSPELTTTPVPVTVNEDRIAYRPTPLRSAVICEHSDTHAARHPPRTNASTGSSGAQSFWPMPHAEEARPQSDDRDRAGISALSRDSTEPRIGETLRAHVGNCIAVQSKLQNLENHLRLLDMALHSLRMGIVLVAPGGEILHSNAQAEMYFQPSWPLLAKQGRLHARQPSADRHLRELIVLASGSKRCAEGTQPGTLTLAADGTRALVRVLVAPLYGTSPPAPAVVLLSKDETLSQDTAQFVLKGMNLTPTETRCAALLAQGHSIDEIAQRLPAQRNTVRCHLRNMFLKTGAKTQTALVAMLHRQIAAFGLTVTPTVANQ